MPEYIDLWINNVDDKLAKLLKQLGYLAVSIPGYRDRIGSINGLKIIRSKVFIGDDEKNLRKSLRGVKEDYPIVLVDPRTIQAARFAGRDSRVDGIVISSESVRVIDRAQISLMRQFSKPLILPLRSFISMSSRLKSMCYRRIVYAYNHGVDIIPVSSGSGIYDIMIPDSTIRLLEGFFDIGRRYWLYTLTNLPRELLVKNGVRI